MEAQTLWQPPERRSEIEFAFVLDNPTGSSKEPVYLFQYALCWVPFGRLRLLPPRRFGSSSMLVFSTCRALLRCLIIGGQPVKRKGAK